MEEVYKEIGNRLLSIIKYKQEGFTSIMQESKQTSNTHKRTMRWIVAHHHRKSCCLQAWKIGT